MSKLFICGSNRKQNSFKIVSDLSQSDDKVFNLFEMNIKNCLGCNSCLKNLDEYCVIKDDMQNFFK